MACDKNELQKLLILLLHVGLGEPEDPISKETAHLGEAMARAISASCDQETTQRTLKALQDLAREEYGIDSELL